MEWLKSALGHLLPGGVVLGCAAAGAMWSVGCADGRVPLPVVEPDLAAELDSWLDRHALPPEEYVLSKFQDHDIVLLGEYHRIRHDTLLVQSLIPRLHATGVRTLGIEFARAAEQADLDRLLSGESYNEDLARQISWNQWPWWGYREYVDLLRVAWRLNRKLGPEAAPFRVVGLNARMDWSQVWTPEDRDDPDIMKKVFPDGDPDEFMAATIQREILSRGEKALIYSGINHAYTRFRQPIYDTENGVLVRLNSGRMGNRIQAQIGGRAFLIFLHAPWPAAGDLADPEVYPADGVIDALLARRQGERRRLGFDILDSPFGRLTGEASYWSHANDSFRLDMYCDGWIYQKPLSEYEGAGVIEGWFTEANRLAAIEQISNPDPRVKNRDRSVASLTASMARDVDFKRRFAHLH